MEIAEQLNGRMLSGIKEELKDANDSIVDALFYRGFTDILTNDTTVMNMAKAEMLQQEKMNANRKAKTEKLIKMGRDFLAENGKKAGIITTPSGLQYEVLKKGEGEVPQKTDKVKCHYEGRLIDGTVFDSSIKRGEPAVFGLNQVIKGWTEALSLMPVGSKWRLYIPQELGYGERQAGQIPPYSTLIFDVELLSIEK
jgi:FKBP-type peptidyl-prolyl cis-trans isomerase FklB